MDAIPITKKLIAFGSKKIYLPKFTVALVRTPSISPYHARFLVPLDFSKYDLRDYLYHAYNVKCFNIRSYVKQMPVRDTREQPRHWFRPESKKYMTVEMDDPFVWPELPDLEPWGQKERKQEVLDAARANGALDTNDARNAARKLSDQVKMLLHKREPLADEAIEKKKAEGVELTPAEQAKEEKRLNRERELEKMSRLNLWEDKRTDKVVHSDEASRFTIKA
ncbi:mitochondrial ribosomal protein subunit L23 [Cucurbitaria berberidis CBS 394.84]|uniref:Large ribosomal subunit protein uL23m n=1 Tax=Cucurbitaria berberidis CBS 394.84 TaxID=1168544 RepID=A0A9P4L3Y3_9PLEO|nr:mitochondrial ribosomal protein subunit L23 [Cucurbitaria berberidis CBS 394.84]KAF1840784.1 mitochondrial ribosomal protein subunit L23 [Cucurbitaria berberidis CBS 394.84]